MIKRLLNAFKRLGIFGAVSRMYEIVVRNYFIHINRLKFKSAIGGGNFGSNMQVFNRIYVKVLPGGKMTIGSNFKFTSGSGINPLCRNIKGEIFIWNNALIEIGDNTGLSSTCLWAKERITIGNNVKIGGDCLIMDTDAHSLNYRIRNGSIKDENGGPMDSISAKSSPITIEDDVLIGARSIILKGVTIGARSIIAAGSVVVKSIPSDCIAGGNPCKIIRMINS